MGKTTIRISNSKETYDNFIGVEVGDEAIYTEGGISTPVIVEGMRVSHYKSVLKPDLFWDTEFLINHSFEYKWVNAGNVYKKVGGNEG